MTTAILSRPVRVNVPHARVLPGLVLAASGGLIGVAAGQINSIVSPLLVAMVVGAVVANLVTISPSFAPGLAFATRWFLRGGVVLLGLQLSLQDVVKLGPGVLVVVATVVASGVALGRWLGVRLGLTPQQSLLIACGSSICGAAAIAAVDATIDAEDEDVSTAVALVTAFGTVLIGVIPAVAAVLGLSKHAAGIWAGASVHEVAQVVAVGGVLGGAALGAAVVVKLARVLLLAPVLAYVGAERRGTATSVGKRPPLVPLFMVGFCALVLVHTMVPFSHAVLGHVGQMQTFLLATAMCAVGCHVRIRDLRRAGARPLVLAMALTVWVSAIGLIGALLVG